MGFQVWNTETDQPDSDEVFGTQEEASAAMLAKYPVKEPWDGVEVPIAIKEVEETLRTLTKRSVLQIRQKNYRGQEGWTISGNHEGLSFSVFIDGDRDRAVKIKENILAGVENPFEGVPGTKWATRKTAKSDFEQGYEDRMADRPRKIPMPAEGTQVGASDEWRARVMEYDRGYQSGSDELADAVLAEGVRKSKRRPTGRVNVAKSTSGDEWFQQTSGSWVLASPLVDAVIYKEDGSGSFVWEALDYRTGTPRRVDGVAPTLEQAKADAAAAHYVASRKTAGYSYKVVGDTGSTVTVNFEGLMSEYDVRYVLRDEFGVHRTEMISQDGPRLFQVDIGGVGRTRFMDKDWTPKAARLDSKQERKPWVPEPGDRVKFGSHPGEIVSEDLPGFYTIAFDDGLTVDEIPLSETTLAPEKKTARRTTAADLFDVGEGMAVDEPNMVDLEGDETVDDSGDFAIAVKKTSESNWDTEEVMRWAANTESVYWELAEAQGPSDVENIIRMILDGADGFNVDFDEVDWGAVWDDVVELHTEGSKKNEKLSGIEGFWEGVE